MAISLEHHGYFAAKKLMQMLSKPHPSPNKKQNQNKSTIQLIMNDQMKSLHIFNEHHV